MVINNKEKRLIVNSIYTTIAQNKNTIKLYSEYKVLRKWIKPYKKENEQLEQLKNKILWENGLI